MSIVLPESVRTQLLEAVSPAFRDYLLEQYSGAIPDDAVAKAAQPYLASLSFGGMKSLLRPVKDKRTREALSHLALRDDQLRLTVEALTDGFERLVAEESAWHQQFLDRWQAMTMKPAVSDGVDEVADKVPDGAVIKVEDKKTGTFDLVSEAGYAQGGYASGHYELYQTKEEERRYQRNQAREYGERQNWLRQNREQWTQRVILGAVSVTLVWTVVKDFILAGV